MENKIKSQGYGPQFYFCEKVSRLEPGSTGVVESTANSNMLIRKVICSTCGRAKVELRVERSQEIFPVAIFYLNEQNQNFVWDDEIQLYKGEKLCVAFTNLGGNSCDYYASISSRKTSTLTTLF